MMRFVEILYSIPRLIIIILFSFIFDPILQELARRPLGSSAARRLLKIIILILASRPDRMADHGAHRPRPGARVEEPAIRRSRRAPWARATPRIIFRHLLPNLVGIMIIYLTLTIPAVILDESFLGFLGLGIQAPQASWGACSATARR